MVYHIWFKKWIRQIKGKEDIEINRVQSFYPIYDDNEISKINSNYEKVELSEKLNAFVKK